jgi:hypothetical protein
MQPDLTQMERTLSRIYGFRLTNRMERVSEKATAENEKIGAITANLLSIGPIHSNIISSQRLYDSKSY